jgi:thymidylate kinase
MKTLVVELVGLPGAGKTELTKLLLGRLEAQHLAVEKRTEVGRGSAIKRLAFGGAILLRNARLTLSLIRAAFRLKPYMRGRLRQTLRIPAWPSRWNLATRRGTEVMILEEGLVQNLWALVLGGIRPDYGIVDRAIQELARYDQPIAFVFLDVSVATTMQRISGRKKSTKRIDMASTEAQTRILGEGGCQLREILDRTANYLGAPILEIDAEKSTADLVPEVLTFITMELGARRR